MSKGMVPAEFQPEPFPLTSTSAVDVCWQPNQADSVALGKSF